MNRKPIEHHTHNQTGEYYRYDSKSQRISKTTSHHSCGDIQIQRVLYLSGLELRLAQDGAIKKENLQIINVAPTKFSQFRILKWVSGRPKSVSNNQLRYNSNNLSKNISLELDNIGKVISKEDYYPYGGTSVWMTRNQTEADYKTIRYSGKERDSTGLYYYEYRYYQPWAGRWLSADPALTIDGLNLFRMVRNNPLTFYDQNGLAPIDLSKFGTVQDYQYAGPKMGVRHLGFMDNESLGLFGIEREFSSPVEISTKTLNHMTLAQNANKKTKELIPYGSPNMLIDVWMTKGKNRQLALPADQYHAPKDIIERGAGTCGAHADIAFSLLASQGINTPIMRMFAHDYDHAYVLIGDPRETSHLVVSDPWVTLPTAHLDEEGLFTHVSLGRIIRTHPAGIKNDPHFLIDDSWKMSTESVKEQKPEEILWNLSRYFRNYVSVSKVGHGYKNNGLTYRFDGFSHTRVDGLFQAQKTIERYRREITH